MDFRISFTARSAQRRLDFWQALETSIQAQNIRDAAHGKEVRSEADPVDSALASLIRAHIRFAQVQLHAESCAATAKEDQK